MPFSVPFKTLTSCPLEIILIQFPCASTEYHRLLFPSDDTPPPQQSYSSATLPTSLGNNSRSLHFHRTLVYLHTFHFLLLLSCICSLETVSLPVMITLSSCLTPVPWLLHTSRSLSLQITGNYTWDRLKGSLSLPACVPPSVFLSPFVSLFVFFSLLSVCRPPSLATKNITAQVGTRESRHVSKRK